MRLEPLDFVLQLALLAADRRKEKYRHSRAMLPLQQGDAGAQVAALGGLELHHVVEALPLKPRPLQLG